MSVELLDTTRFHGYRVRRQIGGKTYQEYFSLKKDGRRLRGPDRAKVKRAAEKRDEVLARMQEKAKAEAAKTAIFDKDGKVRGILFRMKTEKSGTQTPVFQIGIMSSRVDKIVNTTVSINLHGLQGAWRHAVEFYCEHKNISKRSKTYSQLLRAQPTRKQLENMKRRRKSSAKKTTARKARAKSKAKVRSKAKSKARTKAKSKAKKKAKSRSKAKRKASRR